LEDRATPALLADAFVVNAADAGAPPEVRLLNATTGVTISRFLAFDGAFLGGVRVATGDLNRDDVPDLVVAAGPGGGPVVRAFSGRDGSELATFFAYGADFSGGVHVATGDVNNDGYDDIVTGTGAGGAAQVSVFSGKDFSQVMSFFAYETSFRGGVRVAAGDLNGDGFAEVITGAGASGGPHVQVFDKSGKSTGSFFAYDPSFKYGVFVAAGDVTGDGKAEIVTGTSFGGGAHVRTFVGTRGQQAPGPLASFFAYESTFTGGVRVATADMDGDGDDDIVTSPGPKGAAAVKVFTDASDQAESSFFAFPATYTGGTFITAGVGVVTYPTTPETEFTDAYEQLYYERARDRINPPPTVIIVNVPYPVQVFGGFGGFNNGFGFWPYFYDAPGRFLSPGSFFDTGYYVDAGINVYDPGYYADPIYYGDYGYYDPEVFEPGYVDPQYVDPNYYVEPTYLDPAYEYDPGYVDPGYYDPGYSDPGYNYDPGYSDPGYYYDPGFYDPGYYDPGYYDSGYYDPGYYDSGYYDPGYYDYV